MSYDLEVRSDPNYSKPVTPDQIADILLELTGVERRGAASFAVKQEPYGICISIDAGLEPGKAKPAATNRINGLAFSVPYYFLDKSGPMALHMALEVAGNLGWSVYDPQTDSIVTKTSLQEAIRLQRSSGAAAQKILGTVAADELSLSDLFIQEMWNHSLGSLAGIFLLVTVLSGWAMVTWMWSMDQVGRYMPWAMVVGGVVLLWLKGFLRAYRRLGRIQREQQKRADAHRTKGN